MSTAKEKFSELQSYMESQIIGQTALVQKLLLALLSDGHLLVEGLPGLAKTKAVKVLSGALDAGFQRIQFTPDLLPSDITGSDVYRPEMNCFNFKKGPIFNNLILADEINRAPAKVQSALLEAMGERQVTVGNETYRLPDLFMVMATQNPIEQEGTYNLPEAQLDRFLMYVKIGYPNIDSERKILKLIQGEEKKITPPYFEKITQDQVFQARQEVLDVYMSPELEEYLVQFIMATRHPEAYGEDLGKLIQYGVSPRGTIALDLVSRAAAWLRGGDFVTPKDIQSSIPDVLRHRIVLSFEAKSSRMTTDEILQKLLERVPLP